MDNNLIKIDEPTRKPLHRGLLALLFLLER